jgi:hypothetical protein
MNDFDLFEDVELAEDFAEFDDDFDDPDESYAFEGVGFAEIDDDDLDDEPDEAEGSAELLLPFVGGAVASRLFRRKSPRKFSMKRGSTAVRGVKHATLNTPAGSARLRLPTSVVPRSEFLRVQAQDRRLINRNTKLVNTTQKDLGRVRSRVRALAAAQQRQLAGLRKAHKADIDKLRGEQRSREMTNLLMTMMMQNRLQDRVDSHTHPAWAHTHGANGDDVATDAGNIPQPGDAGDSNQAMMFLPLLMGQQTDGDDGNMMMMMMMMAFQNQS